MTIGTLPNQTPTNNMLGTAAYVNYESLGAVPASGGAYTDNLTVPSINEGPRAGLRNLFLNPRFDIWQRGTSFTNPSNVCGADRWLMSVGAGVGSASRQAFPANQTDVPGAGKYFARLVSTTTTSQLLIAQKIEDVNLLSGKTLTLSFWIKSSAPFTLQAGYPQIRQDFGSGGSATVTVNNPGPDVEVTTVWQKVTRTFTLASTLGKTVGADSNTSVIFARKDSTIVDFDVAEASLCLGTVGCGVESRPVSLELLMCQRYYYRIVPNATVKILGIGHANLTTQAVTFVPFPVQMRAVPVLEQSGTATDYEVQHGDTATVCSTVPFLSGAHLTGGRVVYTVASGLTAGQALSARNVNTSGFLAFSAEI